MVGGINRPQIPDLMPLHIGHDDQLTPIGPRGHPGLRLHHHDPAHVTPDTVKLDSPNPIGDNDVFPLLLPIGQRSHAEPT